ncbi:hypothetical protein ABT272_36470 [Streptomyces sp900105245]|uniref:Uncharacterized protein n=1 Tax=Streptomyces sp. 900105245 TaxID=3154379 RepID=A0ABV1UHI8_9ACTN
MSEPRQAAKNEARRLQQETGRSYQSALQHLRRQRLEHGEAAEVDERAVARQPIPDELPLLAAHHIDVMCDYFHQVLSHRYYAPDYGDWCRIALYRLTDALEHLHLLIGTIAAHMRHNHLHAQRICAYLQVPSQEKADAFITPAAVRHLAGLLGQPSTETASNAVDINHRIGRGIAERSGFAFPEREATLEAFLAALYSSYPYEPSALDERPEPIRTCAVKATEISLIPVQEPHDD